MDLSKAFVFADHKMLLTRLKCIEWKFKWKCIYGMRGRISDLLKSYLSHRTQIVETEIHMSSSLPT